MTPAEYDRMKHLEQRTCSVAHQILELQAIRSADLAELAELHSKQWDQIFDTLAKSRRSLIRAV